MAFFCLIVSESASANNAWKSPAEGVQMAAYGPNCFGSALYTAGVVRMLRYVDPTELWFWMTSKYCRIRATNEQPQLGDIGSAFEPGFGLVHSFTYIDGEHFFSKNDGTPEEIYKTQAFGEMFGPYYKNRIADYCGGSEDDVRNASNCDHFEVVYYRCQAPPPDFYSQYIELRELDKELSQIEQILEPWFRTHDEKQIEEVKFAFLTLSQIYQNVKHLHYRGDLEFARRALEYRVSGLLQSDRSISENGHEFAEAINVIPSHILGESTWVPQTADEAHHPLEIWIRMGFSKLIPSK
jgi:hypothetical protein